MTSLEPLDYGGSGAGWLLRQGDKSKCSFCLVCWKLVCGALDCHVRSATTTPRQPCFEEAQRQERPRVVISSTFQVFKSFQPRCQTCECVNLQVISAPATELSPVLKVFPAEAPDSGELRHFPQWTLSKFLTYRPLEHNKITVQSHYVQSRLLHKNSN